VRKLTEKEKEELRAKIAVEQTLKHQKEKKLIAHKHQYKKHSSSGGAIGGYFKMAGSGGQSYSSSLRAAKREQAFNQALAKKEPLRAIKLTEAEKEALRKKIAGEA
jgi:hypothetical protein